MSAPAESARRPSAGRRRTASRLAAVQALYQVELAHAPVENVIREFVLHRLGREGDGERFGDADPALFGDLVRGAAERQDELDHLISSVLAPDWPLDRLETVLRAILRVGVYELLAREDVPVPVVISEYLDICHAFYSGKEPALLNGVLDRLAHTLRPDEFAKGDRDGGAPS